MTKINIIGHKKCGRDRDRFLLSCQEKLTTETDLRSRDGEVKSAAAAAFLLWRKDLWALVAGSPKMVILPNEYHPFHECIEWEKTDGSFKNPTLTERITIPTL